MENSSSRAGEMAMWVKVALCKSNDSSSVPGFHIRSSIQVIPAFPQKEERQGWVIYPEACEPASLEYASQ